LKVESTRKDHREQALEILKRLIALNKSQESYSTVKPRTLRIGFCGSPGAGKSSLIEKLGLYVCDVIGKKLAVLAIDPSSRKTGGSILGDKTRMEVLSMNSNSFIRPSATKGVLGGLALNTSEMILLCESINGFLSFFIGVLDVGYEIVFVESVGVGQNEIEIDNVVDFVVYVVPPGSGDALQVFAFFVFGLLCSRE
jgi:LAO/AO transport system kinase